MPRAALALFFSLLTAGCGGGDDTDVVSYAGMNQLEAAEQGMLAARDERLKKASPISGHDIRPAAAVKSRNSLGKPAWLVRLPDRTTGKAVCVWIWAEKFLQARTFTYEYDLCGAR